MTTDFHTLAQSGARALRAGAWIEARDAFAAIAAAGRADASVFVALAMAERGLGDAEGARKALGEALARDPANLRALIVSADLEAEAGNRARAGAIYMNALKAAARAPRQPPDVQADLARAERICAAYAEDYERFIRKQMELAGVGAERRVAHAVDILFGRRKVYRQEPRRFHVPELPQIEFYDPAQFPWLEPIRAATPSILEELSQIEGREDAFVPYLEKPSLPGVIDRAGLGGARNWTAHFLCRDGVMQEGAARFPATMAALSHAPLTQIPAGAPSILFSRLKPGASIPPHTGMTNARLICHLGLVTPPDCGLRVGAEVRAWARGEALVFDDSIEHEAWNRSDRDRIILLFDVWRPEIAGAERSAIGAIFAAIAQSGGQESWGD
jgi:aspartyl/asparaginyl beta-hydroxylase (cupin superfamily)